MMPRPTAARRIHPEPGGRRLDDLAGLERRPGSCSALLGGRWSRLPHHVPVRHPKNLALPVHGEAVLLIEGHVLLLVGLEVRPCSCGVHPGAELRHQAAADSQSLTISIDGYRPKMPMQFRRVVSGPLGYPLQHTECNHWRIAREQGWQNAQLLETRWLAPTG